VDIRNEVKLIISKQLKIPIELLTPHVRLQDLGAESLDFVEVLFELEEKFDISIPFNANQAVQRLGTETDDGSVLLHSTVEELANLVESMVAKKSQL
jgi:acyl carrier protein